MKTVLISPYAQNLRNGSELHPKNFPHWEEVVNNLLAPPVNINVIQIGATKDKPIIKPFKSDLHTFTHGESGNFYFLQNLSFANIKMLVDKADTWVSVDSFLQHLCAYHKCKRGIVLWGQSDPNIFGYKHNVNLLKNRRHLRPNQFWLWEQAAYLPETFVTAKEVVDAIQLELRQTPK